MKKRLLAMVLSLSMCVCTLSGCAGKNEEKTPDGTAKAAAETTAEKKEETPAAETKAESEESAQSAKGKTLWSLVCSLNSSQSLLMELSVL